MKICQGYDDLSLSSTDYEKWIPSNTDSRGCLLGRKAIYIRRKRDSKCFDEIDFNNKINLEDCDCTTEDYECDVGYFRPNLYDECTLIDKSNVDYRGEMHKAPENCYGTFQISKGYRRIPGNSCINGIKYDPIVVSCPNSFFSTLGVVFFIMILIIIVGCVMYIFSLNFSDKSPNSPTSSRSKNMDSNLTSEEEDNLVFNAGYPAGF